MFYKRKSTLFFLLFCAFSLSGQTVLINENFSSGSLPAGWSNIDNGSSPAGQIWEFNNANNITKGNFSGNYAILDSDNYGSGNSQNATLQTPAFNTSTYESITLEYDYQYRPYQSPESGTVEVFNGTTWTTVASYTTNSGNNYNNATHVTLNITVQSGGAANAKVRFTYTGDWDYWWAIDNVKITGTAPASTTSYLGPGGVGDTDGTSSLVLWTKPDNITESDNANFSSWADASGYGSNLTQGTTSLQPIIKKSIVNGYDVVRFDTSPSGNERLRKTSFSNFPTTSISGFYVNKTTDSGDGIFSYASSSNSNNFLLFGSNSVSIYRSNTGNTGIAVNNNAWNIFGFRWKKDGGTTTASLNGNNSYSGTLGSGTQITAGGTFALAGEQDSVDGGYDSAQAHQGDFSEVILFNSYISEVQRIIVSNYLSAKYNIALSANDFYKGDDTGFDHDVAGIGRASDGSLHTDSQGTGIVRMNTPSDLSFDEYLFWGRSNRTAYAFSTTADYKERLNNSWKVSKRNDLGTVTVEIDLTGVDLSGKIDCAPLQLVVDNNSDFSSPTQRYNLVNFSGSKYRATGVSFSNNDYFTLEYLDKIVVDNTKFYNGSGTGNVPNTSDDCYKLLVKSTANGTLTLTENADVREVEVEAGGKLIVNSGTRLQIENGMILNGDIRLLGTAQLLQMHTGAKQVSGTGKLYVDQNVEIGSKYLFSNMSSPVATTGQSYYTVASVMKDGTTPTSVSSTPKNISFIGGYDGNFSSSPSGSIALSDYWIFTYEGVDDTGYNNNNGIGSSQTINPGKGFMFKGPGRAQNYTFVGLPNDGDYTYADIPSGVNILIGNPYPSAFNIQKFLADNSSIGDTAYLWQHVGVEKADGVFGHYQQGYVGGYATINTSTSAQASTPTQINYILEAESAKLGGSATISGTHVDLKTANDSIRFNFIGLDKPVDSLFIVYSASASKNIDIFINNISKLTNVNLASTEGVIDTLGVLLPIQQNDTVLIKSKDANTTSLDKVYSNVKFSYTEPPFNYLAIGQGFFFYTYSAGSLVFNNSQRKFIPEGTSGSFFFKGQSQSKQKDELPVLKLGIDYYPIANQKYHRQLAVSFKEGNSFSYDKGYDSEMSEKGETDIYWKFPNDTISYVIAGVQAISSLFEVPLEVTIKERQSITFNIDVLQNITNTIYLKDKQSGITYNLSEKSATISLAPGTYTDRFYIAFSSSTLAIDDETIESDDLHVFVDKDSRKLIIKQQNNLEVDTVKLFSILGQEVMSWSPKNSKASEYQIPLSNKFNTIYIVKLKTNKGIYTKKVIIFK